MSNSYDEFIKKEKKNYKLYYTQEQNNFDPSLDNYGFDDDKNYYIIHNDNHLAYRYQILKKIGKGVFGNVVLAQDRKHNDTKAIKIIRNESRFNKSSINEIKILNLLKHGPNIVELIKTFQFRKHNCIIFNYAGVDLYNKYLRESIQISYPLLRHISRQIINGLVYVHNKNIVHQDLKPENILIDDNNRIKIIDFGSSIINSSPKKIFYIQSRWYRAPEPILNLNYDTSVDIWSLGCILYELYTGKAMFRGKNENDQLYLYNYYLGPPPNHMINNSIKHIFFDSENNIIKTNITTPDLKLNDILKHDPDFYDLLGYIIIWDPNHRKTAWELLNLDIFC